MKTQHPGDFLKDLMKEFELNGKTLSDKSGVSSSIISRLLTRKAPMTVINAMRFGRLFGLDPKFLMDIQTNFDLAEMKAIKEVVRDVNAIIPICTDRKQGDIPDAIIHIAGGTTIYLKDDIDPASLSLISYRRLGSSPVSPSLPLMGSGISWDDKNEYGSLKLTAGTVFFHYDKGNHTLRMVGVGSVEVSFNYIKRLKTLKYELPKDQEFIMPADFDVNSLKVLHYKSAIDIDPKWHEPTPDNTVHWLNGADTFSRHIKLGQVCTGRGENINFKYVVATRTIVYTGPRSIIIEFKGGTELPRSRFTDLVIDNQNWFSPLNGKINLDTFMVISAVDRHGDIKPIRATLIWSLKNPLTEIWVATCKLGDKDISFAYDAKFNRLSSSGSPNVCVRFENE